ncbi:MAG: hypothetical protein KI792_00210 [Alphaproteobacteria bacterium]|nr:hypothetical protein [Alphaproteobacteria bacterium SS10]
MPTLAQVKKKYASVAPPPGLDASADEIMDYFFDGKKKYIYDDFPHSYFDEQGSDYKERARAQIRMAFGAVKASTGGQMGNYVLCSISGGIEGHRLAYVHKDKFDEAGDKLTTVKLGEYAGGDIVAERVYGPNTDKNLALSRDVMNQYPDQIAIAPAGLQAMVHQFGANSGFSRGQKWEEEDYMALWFPVKHYFESQQPLAGDPNFSRGANWELMYGASVQAGLVPGRDANSMDVVDGNRRQVSLFRRMEAISNYVRWAAPKGFDVSVGATTLVRLMHMSDQIEAAKEGRPSLIDTDNLHPSLAKRAQKELKAVARLKAQMGPFLKEHAADQIDWEDLGDKWQANLLTGKKGVKPATELDEQIPFDDWGTKKARTAFAGFKTDTTDIHVYRLKGDYFGSDTHSMLFEDDTYNRRLNERERLILPFLLAASETALPPASKPKVALVLGDPKTGNAAMDAAEIEGIENIAELPGAKGKDFNAIARRNVSDLGRLTEMLRKKFDVGIVRSTAEFDQMFETGGKNGEGVIAPGPDKVGSEARVAFRNKMIDRSVDRLVVMDGWEQSPSYVQHMVRATLVQSGLVPRDTGSGQDFMVFDQRGNELSLADRIKTLSAFVERAIDNDVEVPHQSLALARMLELFDRQVDPNYRSRKGVEVSAQVAHPSVTTHIRDGQERDDIKEIRDRVRPKLIDHASRGFSDHQVKDLNEDYWKARQRVVARDQLETRRRPGQGTILSPGRPTAG